MATHDAPEAYNLPVPAGDEVQDPDVRLTLPAGSGDLDADTVVRGETGDEAFGEEARTSTAAQDAGRIITDRLTDDSGDADTMPDTPELDETDIAAQIARSEALVAAVAEREARRLDALLFDTRVTDPAAREALIKAKDRLVSTESIHAAHIPVAETSDPSDALQVHEDDVRQARQEVADAQPFVSAAERTLRRTDEAIEAAEVDRHTLLGRFKEEGAAIRLAAMDKTPNKIGLRPASVRWRSQDDSYPGTAYDFQAHFRREDGRPTLTAVSCAFIPDVTLKPDAHFGVNATSLPLTVSARFDGPDMTGIDLVWPSSHIVKNAGNAKFGPALDQMDDADRELFMAMAGKVDKQLSGFSRQGQIEFDFRDSRRPLLAARTVQGIASPNTSRAGRILANSHFATFGTEQMYAYNADKNAFLSVGSHELPPIPADTAMQLVHTLGSFFPILK